MVGLKNVGIRTNSRGKMAHDLKRWREREISRMLHLVPDQQARVAMRVLKYFQLCTPNAPTQYLTVLGPIPTPAIDHNPALPPPEVDNGQPGAMEVVAEVDARNTVAEPAAETVTIDTAHNGQE